MHLDGYGHGYPFEDKNGRVGHPSLFRIQAIQDGTWEPTYSNWSKINFEEYLDEFDFYELVMPTDLLANAEKHGVYFHIED